MEKQKQWANAAAWWIFRTQDPDTVATPTSQHQGLVPTPPPPPQFVCVGGGSSGRSRSLCPQRFVSGQLRTEICHRGFLDGSGHGHCTGQNEESGIPVRGGGGVDSGQTRGEGGPLQNGAKGIVLASPTPRIEPHNPAQNFSNSMQGQNLPAVRLRVLPSHPSMAVLPSGAGHA